MGNPYLKPIPLMELLDSHVATQSDEPARAQGQDDITAVVQETGRAAGAAISRTKKDSAKRTGLLIAAPGGAKQCYAMH
jgi:hypothetical protein